MLSLCWFVNFISLYSTFEIFICIDWQGANNPLDTASYASKRKDDKYVIPLLDVVHIEVGASKDNQPIPSGSNRGRAVPSSQLSESRKLSTKIYLREGAGSM